MHLLNSSSKYNSQEQALRDVKAAATAAQQVLADEARRSEETLKTKCSLVRYTHPPNYYDPLQPSTTLLTHYRWKPSARWCVTRRSTSFFLYLYFCILPPRFFLTYLIFDLSFSLLSFLHPTSFVYSTLLTLRHCWLIILPIVFLFLLLSPFLSPSSGALHWSRDSHSSECHRCRGGYVAQRTETTRIDVAGRSDGDHRGHPGQSIQQATSSQQDTLSMTHPLNRSSHTITTRRQCALLMQHILSILFVNKITK